MGIMDLIEHAYDSLIGNPGKVVAREFRLYGLEELFRPRPDPDVRIAGMKHRHGSKYARVSEELQAQLQDLLGEELTENELSSEDAKALMEKTVGDVCFTVFVMSCHYWVTHGGCGEYLDAFRASGYDSTSMCIELGKAVFVLGRSNRNIQNVAHFIEQLEPYIVRFGQKAGRVRSAVGFTAMMSFHLGTLQACKELGYME